MNSGLIMKSDVLDILFENRNKDYGAYMLRKFYNNRLMKSLSIMMMAVIVFSAFAFLPDRSLEPDKLLFADHEMGHFTPAVKVPEIKAAVIKPKLTPLPVQKFLNNIIIVNNTDSVDILHNLNNLAIGSKTNILINNGGVDVSSLPAIGSGGKIEEPAIPAEPTTDIIKPVDNPEIMPAYPGGMDALRKFLVRNLNNPRDLEEGEVISVKIKFVVGYDGKLQRFELVQDGGSEFNNEVMRVLKKMPAWIPGKSKGQNVPVYFTIPVKFIAEG